MNNFLKNILIGIYILILSGCTEVQMQNSVNNIFENPVTFVNKKEKGVSVSILETKLFLGNNKENKEASLTIITKSNENFVELILESDVINDWYTVIIYSSSKERNDDMYDLAFSPISEKCIVQQNTMRCSFNKNDILNINTLKHIQIQIKTFHENKISVADRISIDTYCRSRTSNNYDYVSCLEKQIDIKTKALSIYNNDSFFSNHSKRSNFNKAIIKIQENIN